MGNYYRLTKPGIVYSNVFTALAGFLLASRWHFSISLFIPALLGIALVIASACVFNNWYDRDIDRVMVRTQNRPLASGTLSSGAALTYGTILAVIGFSLLYFLTNPIAASVVLAGWLVYVFAYTPLKHKSGWALYVGAFAGATPIVGGYAAAARTLDLAALGLFIFLFLWQLPHFNAIATYRYDEYAAAGIPLLAVRPETESARRRARKVFFASLVVLIAGCAAISIIPLV